VEEHTRAIRLAAIYQQALMIACARLAGDEVGFDKAQALYDEFVSLATAGPA
jgi:hypothetical protein